jgi:HlyD family secretion protein
MSCRAEIITAQSEKSLSVPIASILKDDTKNYVWMIENNKAKKQIVEVGMATDTRQQITTGLSIDAIVVTGPSRVVSKIEDGSSLRQKKES